MQAYELELGAAWVRGAGALACVYVCGDAEAVWQACARGLVQLYSESEVCACGARGALV